MKRLRTVPLSRLGRVAAAASLSALTACTFGAPGSLTGAAPGGVMTIDVSLTAFAASSISVGSSAGYSPAELSVPVGTQIRFLNQDSFAHTASAVARTAFPPSSPLTASALTPSASGSRLSAGGWSSGNLAPGAASPVFVADAPGTYLFGCFYHYGAPMRAAIVVQ
jgi:plastocyanin